MGNIRHPRRGSLQFWPRSRARHLIARIRSWSPENKTKPLGFIGFKAGMTHVMAKDNRVKSITKGEEIALPVTIVECPPMTVAGISFYKVSSYSGLRKISSIMAEKQVKELNKRIQIPKKPTKKFEEITEFDDLRLLVHTNPKNTSVGAKKPKLLEVAIGGSKEEKSRYAKEVLGKEITLKDVFDHDAMVDVHGITIGKGFQGTVKRYGVPIRQHKAEKTKRGIATLGSWTPKRVEFTVAQPGKMGYHLRTEYNKRILHVGMNGEEINQKGGMTRYGNVKNQFLLVAGSLVGPKKREVVLTKAIRPPVKMIKNPFDIKLIIK